VKEQDQKFRSPFLLLGFVVTASIVSYFLLGSGFFSSVIPHTDNDVKGNSSGTPRASMGTYLGLAGFDATSDLKIITSEVNRRGTGVAGRIQNTGNRSYKGVTIYYTLHGSGGRLIGSTYALMGEINTGEIKNFETNTINNPVNGTAESAELTSIIGS